MTSKYALRALVELTRQPQGEAMGGRELAESTGIPPQYLSKIMLALRNAGFVMATRGTGGGYMLLRPADAIHLIDVIQVFEGPSTWPHCLLRSGHECSDKHPCGAHSAWGKAQRAYLQFLENTTLDGISAKPAHESQVTRSARPR
jgi:Rrf2 family protein